MMPNRQQSLDLRAARDNSIYFLLLKKCEKFGENNHLTGVRLGPGLVMARFARSASGFAREALPHPPLLSLPILCSPWLWFSYGAFCPLSQRLRS